LKENALQVLLVEDNVADASLIRRMFSHEKRDSVELTHFVCLSEAEKYLAKSRADIVLLDMGLPDGHGLDTVRRARAAAPGVPVIVLTGLDDEKLAAEAMKAGAQDYLIKGQIENRALPRALRHSIERHRMQTETALIQTHQMQFKDEFLSHVSHELRSPLTAIYQFTTILLDGLAGELKPEQHEYMGSVLRNVKQLQSMINDLLEVTRVQAGKLVVEPQCTSVDNAIAYAVNTLRAAATNKGITLSSDIMPQLPSVYADPIRVRQILIILIDNAIKFTPANGWVKVQARRLEEDPTLLVLEVSDSGCGISPQMTERIFERLLQATDPALEGRKGLGLGLYICKELVMRLGGRVWASSTLGEGSTFSVTLPIFSLPSLIAPAFRKEDHADGLITVIVTEIGSTTGWLSDEVRAEQSYGVRGVLQHCLYSPLDILLPKMGSTGAVELFFIVAITDGIGGEAITKRIREQLRAHIQQGALTLSTSYKSLTPAKGDSSESMKDRLDRVTAGIQELMNEEISSRMAGNG
jgi:signal transduction histidine kinase